MGAEYSEIRILSPLTSSSMEARSLWSSSCPRFLLSVFASDFLGRSLGDLDLVGLLRCATAVLGSPAAIVGFWVLIAKTDCIFASFAHLGENFGGEGFCHLPHCRASANHMLFAMACKFNANGGRNHLCGQR